LYRITVKSAQRRDTEIIERTERERREGEVKEREDEVF
jgi:hypothetical protein